jgi:glucosamine-phosphate N-acetyltransferase
LVLSTPLPDHECVRLLSALTTQQWTIFVVIDTENNVVCWTCTVYVQQKLSKWGVLSAQIEEVAVHSWYQWKWIGTVLLNTVIDFSRDQWCYKAVLNCEEHNIWRYERFGFEKKEIGMKMYL